MKYPTRALVFLALALCAGMAFGQGLTTGVLSGVVTDADNAVLPGVSVEAVHADTGTRYSGQTGADGRFSFQNVRPGAYIVTVTLEGFHPQEVTDPVVALGEATVLSFRLELETVTETVTVVGESNPLITASRTGASSNISTGQIENLPNIDRGFNDFARLNPFMVPSAENEDPEAISVAGRSTRFNNIQIDGAVNNDLFGLADSG
ncbi:MAG: carboxypeptidase-like regulatory domain-containing protein, partial [Thermoanaerobaculia bacterium]